MRACELLLELTQRFVAPEQGHISAGQRYPRRSRLRLRQALQLSVQNGLVSSARGIQGMRAQLALQDGDQTVELAQSRDAVAAERVEHHERAVNFLAHVILRQVMLRQGNAGLIIALSLAVLEHSTDRGVVGVVQRFPFVPQPLLVLGAFRDRQSWQERPAIQVEGAAQRSAPPGAGWRGTQARKRVHIRPDQRRVQADVIIAQLQEVRLGQGAAQMGQQVRQVAACGGLMCVRPEEEHQIVTCDRAQTNGQAPEQRACLPACNGKWASLPGNLA